jgi:beta-glucosidase
MWTFGFGMSYTQFTYEDLQLSSNVVSASDTLTATVRLTNTGEDVLADEVVQLYVVNPARGGSDGCRSVPRIELKAFERVRSLAPGASTVVSLCVAVASLAVTDHDCESRALAGQYTLYVGGRQPGTVGTAEEASSYGTPRAPLQAIFSVTAEL